MAITAKAARHLRFEGNSFMDGARRLGEIRLACPLADHDVAVEGDLDKIRQNLVRLGHSPATATREAQSVKDFYSLGDDCLWLTLANDHLWWTFAKPDVIWVSNGFVPTGERVRKSIGGWSNADLDGVPLRLSNIGIAIGDLNWDCSAGLDEKSLQTLLDLINGTKGLEQASPLQAPGPEFVGHFPGVGNETQFPAFSQLFTVGDVTSTPSAAPEEPGVYSWWFDQLPNVPMVGALEQNGYHLAYVGIASHRPGSRRTLRQRLRNHCCGPIATSTLRRSLAALLIEELDLHPYSEKQKTKIPPEEEARLTDWLTLHGRVAWIPDPTPWILENNLLGSGPPLALNIRGNTHHFVPELLAVRKRLSDLGLEKGAAR
jgi:hypothetical protein